MGAPTNSEIFDVLIEETIALAGGASQNIDIPMQVKTGTRRGPFLLVRLVGQSQRARITLSTSDADPAAGGNPRIWLVESGNVATIFRIEERVPASPWVRVTILNNSGGAGTFPIFIMLAPMLAIPQGGR